MGVPAVEALATVQDEGEIADMVWATNETEAVMVWGAQAADVVVSICTLNEEQVLHRMFEGV